MDLVLGLRAHLRLLDTFSSALRCREIFLRISKFALSLPSVSHRGKNEHRQWTKPTSEPLVVLYDLSASHTSHLLKCFISDAKVGGLLGALSRLKKTWSIRSSAMGNAAGLIKKRLLTKDVRKLPPLMRIPRHMLPPSMRSPRERRERLRLRRIQRLKELKRRRPLRSKIRPKKIR